MFSIVVLFGATRRRCNDKCVAKCVGFCAVSKLEVDFSSQVAKADVPLAEYCLYFDAICGY